MSLFLISLQMIRVISSPSSSTTGFATLIFDMILRTFLITRPGPAALPLARGHSALQQDAKAVPLTDRELRRGPR